jgi:hypothetical protein
VREMAHVRVIDVASYEPAHRATRDHIRSEVFLRRDSRRAHYPGQAVRSYAHDFLVLILVVQQRGDRPDLNRTTGRE